MRLNDDLLDPRRNNFTAVRLLLASLVIYTHSYWAVWKVLERDDLSGWIGAPVSELAVDGFFFLSGFLVYPSLARLGSPWRFMGARLVRLWPALAASVLATTAVGWFLTTTPGAYWTGETLRFVFGNLSLLKAGFALTGVECGDNLCPVNGSLWTLPWEARCYVALALLGAAGLAAPRAMLRLVLPLSAAAALAWHLPGVREGAAAVGGEGAVFVLDLADRLGTMFFLGVAAFILRNRIPLSWPLLGALAALVLLSRQVGEVPHLRAAATGYAVLCLGFLTARTRAVSAAWPDYSYGVYIYAFPLMMVIDRLLPDLGHLELAALNLLAVLPVAAASWHLLEKPALDWWRARARARRASPLGSGAPAAP